ncbi:uncharacterized protein N0V96_011471 [Colletotrichum fioriniae]|uniref:uncharacterized protein n=1 Tax=Colletotrichum fioriniae TaxID=710243 RepID=UPI0032DBB5A7|nr:hypothetical protein N0V96_011471 [Colletotrichum fioriniae]
MASRTRSLSRDRYRDRSRSLTPLSDRSRSPVRRHTYDSRSPSRSRSPTPRRNGRQRSESRSRSRGRSASPAIRSTKVVVERLTKNINEAHLEEIFGQFGHIKDLDLPINRTHGTNRGTAYILYDTEADAEDAIAHMHEAQLDGAHLLPLDVAEAPMPEAAEGEELRADSTAVEEADPVLSARTLPDGVHHHLRVVSAPDQTPTGLDRFRVPQADLPSLLLRPEAGVEADTEAVQDHTPGLHHHPRDVEEVPAPSIPVSEP